MKQRPFGKTGLSLSEIGLGAWGLGGVYYGKVERAEGVRAVRAFLDAGGTHIDTAFSYHESEAVIGEAIRGYDRTKLVIASKSFASLSYDRLKTQLRQEVEISLRDLGIDYFDLYYLHGPTEDYDLMMRGLETFQQLKAEGKARAICSSLRGPLVDDGVPALARRYLASGLVDGFQMIYSVLRQKSAAFFAEARAAGVGIVARTVLESGLLTGKYPPGTEFIWPDQRARYGAADRDAVLAEAQYLQSVLPPGYENPAQLAAKFALANPDISGIILGGVNERQIARNAAMAALPDLPADLVARLCERYAARNDTFNPSGTIEHIPSVRSGVSG